MGTKTDVTKTGNRECGMGNGKVKMGNCFIFELFSAKIREKMIGCACMVFTRILRERPNAPPRSRFLFLYFYKFLNFLFNTFLASGIMK